MSFYKVQPLGLKASKVIEEAADESRFRKHRQRVVRPPPPRIDDNPPAVYPHIELRLKALKLEESRVSRVDGENRRLLRRLIETMEAPARVNCFNRTWEPRPSSNNLRRKQRNLSIVKANERIVTRILEAKSHFDWHSLERDWHTHEDRLKKISKYHHPWRNQAKTGPSSVASFPAATKPQKAKLLTSRQHQLHPNHLDVLQQKIDTIDALTKLPSLTPSTLANTLTDSDASQQQSSQSSNGSPNSS